VSLCQSLNLRLGHRGEVCVFGSNDPFRNLGMMSLQVFFQKVGGIAFSGSVTDKDDLSRRSEIFRDFLIKRILFGYALAAVVRFLAMNQMMMEIERIIRSHRAFVCRTTSAEISVNMGGVVVDDHNHTAGLGRFFCMRALSGGVFQELTQPRNFLYTKIVSVGFLEKYTLGADPEHKFVVSMRLDFAEMLHQLDGLAPT